MRQHTGEGEQPEIFRVLRSDGRQRRARQQEQQWEECAHQFRPGRLAAGRDPHSNSDCWKGHWLTGTMVIVTAYAVSLLLIERLFSLLKPKLLKRRRFAKMWS